MECPHEVEHALVPDLQGTKNPCRSDEGHRPVGKVDSLDLDPRMDDLGPDPTRFRSQRRPGDCCGHASDRGRTGLADLERDRSVQTDHDMVARVYLGEVAHLRTGNDGIEFATIVAQQDRSLLDVDRFDHGLCLDEVADDNRRSVQWDLCKHGAAKCEQGSGGKRLEYQTATSDVLKVISRSTFDLQPVLGMVAETAVRLCFADQAVIFRREGELYVLAANFGFPAEYEAYWTSIGAVAVDLESPFVGFRCIREACPVHIHDVAAVPGYRSYGEAPIRLGRQRTSLGVPLLRDGEVIGTIVLARQRVEPFTDRQIALVSTFADQAVIAIENTRLITEQQEALEQQTATAEVLQVINASPGDLAPVFDAMLEKAMRLCGAAYGVPRSFDGKVMRILGSHGVPPAYAEFLARNAGAPAQGTAVIRALQTGQPAQTLDAKESVGYKSGASGGRAIADLGGARTILHVPLVKDQVSVGLFTFYRREVQGFSDKQIALLENFAAQAVIAMENARLLNEIRQRQEELRVTFENMGDGVAMFDETQHLVAWNRKFQDILDVPDEIIARAADILEYIRYLAERGEYGAGGDPEEQVPAPYRASRSSRDL